MKKPNWISIVFITTFMLSIVFSFGTNLLSVHSNTIVTIVIILAVIAIGILFDMIGVATLSANEKTFHAMSAQKIKGAKTANKLIKNNVKVSSVCNDIVGDICGIVSGGLGAVLAISLSSSLNINITIMTMIVSAVISSLNVATPIISNNIPIAITASIITIVTIVLL